MPVQKTISPIDGSIVAERPLATDPEIERALAQAHSAQIAWREQSLAARSSGVGAWVDAVLASREAAATELTLQMGRPRRFADGEFGGFEERARRMIELAPKALRGIEPQPKPGFTRYIERVPHGVVLVLAPWNYPWLTAVNAIAPALLAGNTVVLKHSDQTPLVAERMIHAAQAANLPDGVLQFLHIDHQSVARVIGDSRVNFVAFTGSVDGGRAVRLAAAKRFIGMGLELGGKDPAYVAEDAPFEHSVVNIADGAFFNSGQSCCGIERVYVHESLYDRFVEAFVAETRKLILGDPRDPATTLGPVVRVRNAKAIQQQIERAIAAGAEPLIDKFEGTERDLPYLPPQVLINVTHEMEIMTEETFGPAVGIMKVKDDDIATQLMNDSRYGLTASIWSADVNRARRIGEQLQTGTVFLNRCDYLDPDLAWTGVKDSGFGCTLSPIGFEQLTRPKSFHLRTKV